MNRGLQLIAQFVAFLVAAVYALLDAVRLFIKTPTDLALIEPIKAAGDRVVAAIGVAELWFKEATGAATGIAALPGVFSGKGINIMSSLTWSLLFGDPFKGSRSAFQALVAQYGKG